MLGNRKANRATSASGMARRATDVAKAVNNLLDFSGDDQAALLDVIQDYFCEPESQDDEQDEDGDDSLDHEDEPAAFEVDGTYQQCTQ